MKTDRIDIKSLTSELRSHAGNKKKQKTVSTSNATEQAVDLYDDRSNEQTVHSDVTEQNNESKSVVKLKEIVKKVNSIDQYHIDRFIYVDADIHEVFVKLKSQTKLKISHLASYLLEDFINQHKEAIMEIVNKKTNKFLD
jgi:hypothetical protein